MVSIQWMLKDPKLCCIGNILTKLVHPLTRKSDWLLISLYSITPESHVKFMRVKEMIANLRSSCSSNKFFLVLLKENRENSVEDMTVVVPMLEYKG